MLQNILMKKIIDIILKQFNLDKIQKYVEQPNELDKKVSVIEKKLEKLNKLAHPVADFVCTDCGTKAKRVKSKVKSKVKRKLNKLKEKF
jgi:DNA-binding transcriptional MerR regulator